MAPNPDRVLIFDTTLRDGEQSPGCSMTRPEKLRVARALAELGLLRSDDPVQVEAENARLGACPPLDDHLRRRLLGLALHAHRAERDQPYAAERCKSGRRKQCGKHRGDDRELPRFPHALLLIRPVPGASDHTLGLATAIL